MSRFWIADLHFGHDKVAGLRGFDSTLQHDTAIAGGLMNLRKGDQLWVLGDVIGRDDHADHGLRILQMVKDTTGADLHLIAGNHDPVSSIHRNGFKHQKKWMQVFDSVQQFGRFKFDGAQVFMSHFPFARSGDGANRDGARFLDFRLPDLGNPLMHGHTHQSTPHMQGDLQQFCVSWDAWGRLVSDQDVADWIKRWRG